MDKKAIYLKKNMTYGWIKSNQVDQIPKLLRKIFSFIIYEYNYIYYRTKFYLNCVKKICKPKFLRILTKPSIEIFFSSLQLSEIIYKYLIQFQPELQACEVFSSAQLF